jgi:hypothetical protein
MGLFGSIFHTIGSGVKDIGGTVLHLPGQVMHGVASLPGAVLGFGKQVATLPGQILGGNIAGVFGGGGFGTYVLIGGALIVAVMIFK